MFVLIALALIVAAALYIIIGLFTYTPHNTAAMVKHENVTMPAIEYSGMTATEWDSVWGGRRS